MWYLAPAGGVPESHTQSSWSGRDIREPWPLEMYKLWQLLCPNITSLLVIVKRRHRPFFCSQRTRSERHQCQLQCQVNHLPRSKSHCQNSSKSAPCSLRLCRWLPVFPANRRVAIRFWVVASWPFHDDHRSHGHGLLRSATSRWPWSSYFWPVYRWFLNEGMEDWKPWTLESWLSHNDFVITFQWSITCSSNPAWWWSS